MGEQPKPYKLKRDGHSNADWIVFDAKTDEEIGKVFKYLGAWWVNNARLLDNRCQDRSEAADLAWSQHLARQGRADA